MTWVLIFAFLSFNTGGGAITQEFADQAACEAAKQEIAAEVTNDSRWFNHTILLCAPKGSKQP